MRLIPSVQIHSCVVENLMNLNFKKESCKSTTHLSLDKCENASPYRLYFSLSPWNAHSYQRQGRELCEVYTICDSKTCSSETSINKSLTMGPGK